jgi:predicted nuclease of restriction endonuclease-like RecB superfamily
MLTADLARSRTTADEVRPLFIDPTDEDYRETARELIELFDAHLGRPKGELDDAIDQLTVADTDYKIIQGLAKLLRDECDFTTVAAAEPREIRHQLFERANDTYPIVRQPTLGDDTQKLDVYLSVADDLDISLEACYRLSHFEYLNPGGDGRSVADGHR